ncbi:DUF1488 domain-containing protein [Paraburkholderia aspalathi]|uniref:DUF1488 domain-containing protein n=1 Tax=Paraburkholderia aspalathi TaxID=1324617 RepID=A0A1I7EJ42_9BURK|nr:DUF1488 domain-containing protein [Paraburkholderia aspalathi]SFU23960.1 Protein of unknown function [Paraburkholderia aspalathi]
MHITFPDYQPVFDGANLTMRFTTRVDGKPVESTIIAEALEDHFDADSALEPVLLAAFDTGRNRIHSVCAEALDRNGGKDVVSHSGLFGVDSMEPDHDTTA